MPERGLGCPRPRERIAIVTLAHISDLHATRVRPRGFAPLLSKRGIGWLAYLLHHSLIADAHRPEQGPLGAPGNLLFIEADGTLRPGHEAFNEF